MTAPTAGPIAGRRLALLTVLLGSLTVFGPLSMDLYLPAFPQLAADLGASQAQVQLTLTADVLGLVAGQLVLGPLSDAWGRRRLLLVSTVVCAVASAMCALAPTVLALTAWRFVQGFAGGGGIVLARAMAADLTSGVAAARLFSLFMTLSSVAPIAAPVAGGALLAWTGDWRSSFTVLAVLNAVLAVALWRSVGESLPPDRRHGGGLRHTGRAFAGLVRDRVFLGYALTVALAYASLFGYISGSSFALQQHYGLSPTQYSAVFALNAAGMVLLGLLNARLVARFAVRRLLVAGLAVSGAAALLLVLGVTAGAGLGLLAVLPPLFVVVTTRGLVSSNATVLGVQRGASAAGSASAVLGAFMFGGGILVTPLVGLGPEGSPVPMALVVAGGAVAALLATVLLTRPAAAPPR